MKFNISIALLVATSTGVLSAAVADAAAECGSLGVMSLDNIPEGVDAANVRTCADHPLGRLNLSNDNSVEPRAAQACWWGEPAGCKDGYCWKSCGTPGQGAWCWTAKDRGKGDWETCSSASDCNTAMECGLDCPSCGCSC